MTGGMHLGRLTGKQITDELCHSCLCLFHRVQKPGHLYTLKMPHARIGISPDCAPLLSQAPRRRRLQSCSRRAWVGWCGCLLSCHRGKPAEPRRSEGRGTPQERDFEPQVCETGLGGGGFQLGGKTPLRADQGVIINDAADRPGLLPGRPKKGSTKGTISGPFNLCTLTPPTPTPPILST